MRDTGAVTHFQIRPIAAAVVEDARQRLGAGDPAVARVIVETPLSSPCRRCLRDGAPGEAMLLFGFSPFTHVGPYVDSGPVFAHEAPCMPQAFAPDTVPDMTAARAQVLVRVYDHRHWIHDAKLVSGADAAAALKDFFADETVAYAHVRSATYQCFAYSVDRA